MSALAARARVLTAAVILLAGCSSQDSTPTRGPSASVSNPNPNPHASAGLNASSGDAGGITEVSSRDLPGGGRADSSRTLLDSPPRYVTWGEGTSDEMCLAILTVGDS